MNAPLHTSEDRLVDLIHRLLPTEEEKLVLAHLDECVSCEERFRVLLHEHESARSAAAPSTTADGGIVSAHRPRRAARRWLIPAVAVAAVLVFALIWRVVPNRETSEAYWVPIDFETHALRSADSVSVGSSEAFRAYESHNAERAIALLRDAPPTDDEMVSSLQQLVMASALVNTGRPGDALGVLEKLEIFSLPVRWRQRAQFVEYLALRDAGRGEEARIRLEVLTGYEGEIGERARAERGN